MAYKQDFPGQTPFQKAFGGKGVTAPSGILPHGAQNSPRNFPDALSLFRRK